MIRNLKISDIPDVMEFFFADRKAHQDERFDFLPEDLAKMTMHSHISQLIWEDEGKAVAYLAGYNMGVWGYIDILIVKASYRNKSIAKKLVNHFLSSHPEWVRLETSCYETDVESINMARNNGFDIEQKLVWFGKEV